MLRNIVLAIGGTLVVVGVGGIFSHHFVPGAVMAIWGAMAVFAIIYERYSPGYRKIVARAPTGKNWIQTPERIIDKQTGKALVVYYQTFTGERQFVALGNTETS